MKVPLTRKFVDTQPLERFKPSQDIDLNDAQFNEENDHFDIEPEEEEEDDDQVSSQNNDWNNEEIGGYSHKFVHKINMDELERESRGDGMTGEENMDLMY